MKVSAAIHERFPDCGIFRRMKVFSCPTAREFFAAWPVLFANANRDLEAEKAIASTFSEIPTQTAFMSLTARQKEFEAALRVQTAHLKILTRRTEPLSPSCTRSVAGEAVLDYGTPDECSRHPAPSLPCVCGPRLATAQMDDVNPSPSPFPTMPTSESPATPSLATHLPATAATPACPTSTQINSTNSAQSTGYNLTVVVINIKNHCFNVLRLSPGPMAPPTPFDIILPPAAAFCNTADSDGALSRYPSFTAAIFERIVQPSLLWDCWGPGSLGKYPDITTLWKSWNEGAVIDGVGQSPPLHLVDTQWGCHKDQRSNKGHLPAWRPRRDDNVSDAYSCQWLLMRQVNGSCAGTEEVVSVPILHEADRR